VEKYFIQPAPGVIERALESWAWVGIGNKRPLSVTAFGDVFFEAPDGVWFLDGSLEGKLSRVCSTPEELKKALGTEESQDHFLLGGFIERALSEGLRLGPNECYDFKIHPRVGGKIAFENIEKRGFVVTLHIRGQLHDQVRHLKPGTKISKFVVVGGKKPAPWRKLW